jgi:methionyl aminopeptidase
MIFVKNADEIKRMREAGRLTINTLNYLETLIRPGITTKELDSAAYGYIKKHNGTPNFLHYKGYPATICASIDDVVVHGIPDGTRLAEGMIISLDMGAIVNGFHGDAARTYPVGRISPEKQRLTDVTRQCFFEAVNVLRDGVRVGDISAAVQTYAEGNGYSVVRALEGHGIGRHLHEDPGVPNYGSAGRGIRLRKGTTIAIEPMINEGGFEVEFMRDGWVCKTKDGKPSAHYENTVVITDDGYEILTAE